MSSLLTVSETARRLRLNQETIRRMARQGRLPGVRISRHWLFAEQDLVELLEQAKVKAPEQPSSQR
jgi:excisionase family DNA binding protein